MAKVREHNEYFRTVSLSNRKSCPNCSVKLAMGEQIWSWGNYVRAKWYTVQYFCCNCFAHMRDVDDVIEGVLEMLAPDGVFVTESHYLIDLIDKLQYDTIYHEHLR